MSDDGAIERFGRNGLAAQVGQRFAAGNERRARRMVSEAIGAFGLRHAAKDHNGAGGDFRSCPPRGRVSSDAEGLAARIAPRSVESSPGLRLLPFVLSVIAGCSDVISFVGLGGLFTAHITGNWSF